MNRRSFVQSVAALFLAPFLPSAKGMPNSRRFRAVNNPMTKIMQDRLAVDASYYEGTRWYEVPGHRTHIVFGLRPDSGKNDASCGGGEP